MARKRSSASRVTVGMTKSQRQQQAARRAGNATVTTAVNSSPSVPRFQLKLLTPCSRHHTDISLPCRPQAALLAPFYLRHWHISLEHHLFTPAVVAEHAAWYQKYAKPGKRKRNRLPAALLAKLRWSSQNVVWPAERWVGEVPHLVFGRHVGLPTACQLRHPCVGRVHARLVCIHTAPMHRFFTDCFPRVRVVRDPVVRLCVGKPRKGQSARARTSGAKTRRASPPRLRHHGASQSSAKTVVTASGKEIDGVDDDVVVIEEKREGHASHSHAKEEPEGAADVTDSEEDTTDTELEDVAPFTEPYYCLVNYHDNLVYVNRTAIPCGHSAQLDEGDVLSFLECAFAADGGVLDPATPPPGASATSSAADPLPWAIDDDDAALASVQELPSIDSWVQLSLNKHALGNTESSPVITESTGGARPVLTPHSAIVVGDRVIAARRPLDIPLPLSHILSLWSRLHALVHTPDAASTDRGEGASGTERRAVGSNHGGDSPQSPAPSAPVGVRGGRGGGRSRSRSTSPAVSTVPLNTSASGSRPYAGVPAASSSSPTHHRASSVLTVVHNQLTLAALTSSSPAEARTTHTMRQPASRAKRGRSDDDLGGTLSLPFAYLPQNPRVWTADVQARILRDIDVQLDALDGDAQEAVLSVHSPLAPSLTIDPAVARRSFRQLTDTLIAQASAPWSARPASRALFTKVKSEPEEEEEETRLGEATQRRDGAQSSKLPQADLNAVLVAEPARVRIKAESPVSPQSSVLPATDGTSPLRRLVKELTERNHGASPLCAAGAGQSPGRLQWKDEADDKDGVLVAADVAWTGDDGVALPGEGDDTASSPPPQTMGGGGTRGEKRETTTSPPGSDDDGQDPMAPMPVAQARLPFARCVPAALPVYVFTRRAASPERCLRETSSWRQRQQDDASSGWAAGGEPGSVYYYYEEEEDDGGITADAPTGVAGVEEAKAHVRPKPEDSEGPPEAVPTAAEEPVWIDETAPVRRRGSAAHSRRGNGTKQARRRRL